MCASKFLTGTNDVYIVNNCLTTSFAASTSFNRFILSTVIPLAFNTSLSELCISISLVLSRLIAFFSASVNGLPSSFSRLVISSLLCFTNSCSSFIVKLVTKSLPVRVDCINPGVCAIADTTAPLMNCSSKCWSLTN